MLISQHSFIFFFSFSGGWVFFFFVKINLKVITFHILYKLKIQHWFAYKTQHWFAAMASTQREYNRELQEIEYRRGVTKGEGRRMQTVIDKFPLTVSQQTVQ